MLSHQGGDFHTPLALTVTALLCLVDGTDALFDVPDIVGRSLIHAVVQPVAVEQMGTGTPCNRGLLRGVIVGEVVSGDLGIDTGVYITVVLFGQRVAVGGRIVEYEVIMIEPDQVTLQNATGEVRLKVFRSSSLTIERH